MQETHLYNLLVYLLDLPIDAQRKQCRERTRTNTRTGS
jgi:hypothetical protein